MYITNAGKVNYDLIIGSRFVNKNPHLSDGMPFVRYITNKFTSFVTSKLLNVCLIKYFYYNLKCNEYFKVK